MSRQMELYFRDSYFERAAERGLNIEQLKERAEELLDDEFCVNLANEISLADAASEVIVVDEDLGSEYLVVVGNDYVEVISAASTLKPLRRAKRVMVVKVQELPDEE